MSIWTEALDISLKEWVAAGKSRSWIAGHISETLRVKCTRNAVVGRIWRVQKRLGIVSPYKPGSGPHGPHISKASKRRAAREQKVLNKTLKVTRPCLWDLADTEAPAPLNTPMHKLTFHQCRAVVDGTDDDCMPLHCGHHAHDGRFCAHHAARYYRPVRRAR